MDALKLLRDLLNIAQKSDNIEMTQKVISAQTEVINMHEIITKLRDENKKLKEDVKLKQNVERHKDAIFITLKNDNPKIPYCSTCFGKDNILIQLKIKDNLCQCPNCKSFFYFSEVPNSIEIRKLLR